MKREENGQQHVYFSFSPGKIHAPKLRSTQFTRPAAAYPPRPFLAPVSPLYPQSAPTRRPRVRPAQVTTPTGASRRSVSPALKALFPACSRDLHTLVIDNCPQMSKKSPLQAASEACALLVQGQSELKQRIEVHETVLLQLKRSVKDSFVRDSRAVIHELREVSRKSARKLWTRSETPNSRVQPAVYSPLPTPRGARNSPYRNRQPDPVNTSFADESTVTFSSGFKGVVQGVEKVTFIKQPKFPRAVFTRRRRPIVEA